MRRTQLERRTTTRAKILDAVVESLLERGYAGTTVTDVQERAGVARGTLLHHFATRAELMAAAVEHVADQRIRAFRTDIAADPQLDLDAIVDIAWRDLNGPMFFAMLELWVAARTDPELRDALAPIERKLFGHIHETLATTVGTDDPRLPTLVQFTIDLLTGLSMSTILNQHAGTQEVVLRRWKRALRVLMGTEPPTTLVGRRR